MKAFQMTHEPNATGTSDIVNINILVMGPSGTGKTSALLIPTLRSWQSRGHPHHLLVRSPVCKFTFENRKTPNISRTIRFRGDFGRFYLIWLYGGGEARYLLFCGNRKAPYCYDAFDLPGKQGKGITT